MELNKTLYSEHIIGLCDEIGILDLNKTYKDFMEKINKGEESLKAILSDKQIRQLNQLLDEQYRFTYFMSNFHYKFGIEVAKNFDFIKQYGLEKRGEI